MRAKAAPNSRESFARMTPRLPDNPSGLSTQGNRSNPPPKPSSLIPNPESLIPDPPWIILNPGEGRPAAASAARERRLSVLASAPSTECHGSFNTAAACAASTTGRSPTAITPATGYRRGRARQEGTDELDPRERTGDPHPPATAR